MIKVVITSRFNISKNSQQKASYILGWRLYFT